MIAACILQAAPPVSGTVCVRDLAQSDAFLIRQCG